MTCLRNSRNNAEVYLIGTAHVSEESAQEVLEVIEKVKPSTIVVELCEARAERLLAKERGGVPFAPRHPLAWLLASLYDYFRLLGREPGKEFKVALQEAKKLKAKVVLADQDINVTVRKLQHVLWAALRAHPSIIGAVAVGAVRAAVGGVRSLLSPAAWLGRGGRGQGPGDEPGGRGLDILKQIEEMKSRKRIREVERELQRLSPRLVEVAIRERDSIMLEHLLKCEGKVVAVVGLAHMDGIERGWHAANK